METQRGEGSRVLQQGQQPARERGQDRHLSLEDLVGSWLSVPVCSFLIYSILCLPWNLTALAGPNQFDSPLSKDPDRPRESMWLAQSHTAIVWRSPAPLP